MILLIRPTDKFLDVAAITTVTTSPGLNVLALKPKCTRVDGAGLSQIQFTTLPLSSLTSSFRKVCGFVQSHAVTVPFMVASLPSYDAFPWCANSGIETANRPTTTSELDLSVFLTAPLPVSARRPQSSGTALRQQFELYLLGPYKLPVSFRTYR